MAEDTIMVLKVDLGCARCYKKIKKLLCKFPEIRDQAFIEKEDTVIIKVVCCSPERIRSKLICKGGKTIKSIEIKVPQKPPAPPKKPTPQSDKPKEDDQKIKPQSDKPKEDDQKTKPQANKPKEGDQKPTPKSLEKPPASVPTPATGYPPLMYPIGVCCKPCYEGRGGGPCHHGYGIPYQPPSYEGYVKLVPSHDGWPSGCRCNRSYGCRCEFFTEENPTCTIM